MIPIVWEDTHLVVVQKPADVLSEPKAGEPDVVTLVSAQVGKPVVLVHRLDRVTGGHMVLAKTREAASRLSASIQNGQFHKEYLAVVHGVPEKPADTWEDLLFKDSSKNKSYVVHRQRVGVKRAKLSYSLTCSDPSRTCSLVRVKLDTGRTHQIRVQFSYRNLPLLGDGKYGSRDKRCTVALWSFHLAFPHPLSGKQMEFFSSPPDRYPWNLFPEK